MCLSCEAGLFSFFLNIIFPWQSIQVLWPGGTVARQDSGGVGQRDQGLVSERCTTILLVLCISLINAMFLGVCGEIYPAGKYRTINDPYKATRDGDDY